MGATAVAVNRQTGGQESSSGCYGSSMTGAHESTVAVGALGIETYDRQRVGAGTIAVATY